jgi:phosphoglycerol transferase MdoB-like AlkP superfamily enzyme
MVATEADLLSRVVFLLSWAFLNLTAIAILRRPGLSGALSLTFIILVVLCSQLKHAVTQMTVNFVDLMIIDSDSVSFLMTIYPKLRWLALAAVLIGGPAMVAMWRLDPFRIRRVPALASALAALAALTGCSLTWPDESWRAYLDEGYVSKFANSGVVAISDFMRVGLMDSDPVATETLRFPQEDSCHPATRRPHIILIHDESSFDLRSIAALKVPPGYGEQFRSFDGKARTFMTEGNGGPSWYTEYNVLAGLSSRSFGRFSYFVTRIAAGRIERGLPLALRRCGYHTVSLYPAHGNFMGERDFQQTTGIEEFYDDRALGADGIEPDSFFYAKALSLLQRRPRTGPDFTYVYLAANHFPWDHRYRPELTPAWRDSGNAPFIDEYLRRQALSAQHYRDFVAQLKRQLPDEAFLIVRYGDHQPDFTAFLVDPALTGAEIDRRLMEYDPRYYATYYAIDAVNFKPAQSPVVMDRIDGAYLPLVVLESAGLPLDPSFEEQKKIMLRCRGVFYDCGKGAEARRFNRLLIDAGLIKNL